MSKLTIDANVLDYDANSLQYEVLRSNSGVERLERRTQIQEFNGVAAIGLANATATFTKIFNSMQLNSRLILTVSGGNYPALDTPLDLSNAFQSGTVFVEGNQISPDRVSAVFLNENGVWYRYFSNAYPSGNPLRDSGWLKQKMPGVNRQITSLQLTSTFGGLLSNIKDPDDYFISGGALNSSVTDSPYGTTGNPPILLSVERMQSDRGIIQTIRDNTANQSGYRRQISSSGVVGSWVQEFTSRSDASTQHMSPRTPNTYNVGGVSSAYANGYFQNAITVVSDRDHKPIVEAVPDNILDIWGQISPKRYKYDWAIEKKGVEGARWHVGWIAQDILEAFAEAGEDATEWALITYNEWDESEEVPAGHQWRLVMDECLAMEALYQRRRLSKIEDAIV